MYGMFLPNTFPAVFLQSESGQTYVRCLTARKEEGESASAEGRPPLLEKNQIHFNFQYPSGNFKVTWRGINIIRTYLPVVPYDRVANACGGSERSRGEQDSR